MAAEDFASNGKKHRLIIILIIVLVLIALGIVAWWFLRGEQEWERRQEREAGIAENKQQLQEAEARIQSDSLGEEDQYNNYVRAAMLAAGQNKPEAREYAKKALEIREGLIEGDAGMEDSQTELLRQIEQGIYNSEP